MRPQLLGQAAILGALLANSAAAADRMPIYEHVSDRGKAAGYVGVTVSLLQSKHRNRRPSIRLGGGLGYGPGVAAGTAITQRAPTLEFELAGPGHGRLLVGGRQLAAAESEGGLKAGHVMLIVAGIAASAFLVAGLAGTDDDEDEQCLIEPELCH